jgi:hypothetical protein
MPGHIAPFAWAASIPACSGDWQLRSTRFRGNYINHRHRVAIGDTFGLVTRLRAITCFGADRLGVSRPLLCGTLSHDCQIILAGNNDPDIRYGLLSANGVDRPAFSRTAIRRIASANVSGSGLGPESSKTQNAKATSPEALGGRCEIKPSWSGTEFFAIRIASRVRWRWKYSACRSS